jgi:hypothetical protein
MAETIEYQKILKFINDEIVAERLNRNAILNRMNHARDAEGNLVVGNQYVSNINLLPSFSFNPSTGLLTAQKPTVNDLPQQFGIYLHDDTNMNMDVSIFIEVNGNIRYYVNDVEIPVQSVTNIEGKPIHTTLVLLYLNKKKHIDARRGPAPGTPNRDANYLYRFEDDGTIRLFQRNVDGTQGDEIPSITSINKDTLSGNNPNRAANLDTVCQRLFNVNNEDQLCIKHMTNVIAKSAMGLLNNFLTINQEQLSQGLRNAEPNIQYEILRTLNWKMNPYTRKLVSVDDWINKHKTDNNDNTKRMGEAYEKFFTDNNWLKEILDVMVNSINNNTSLLEQKYKEVTTKPQLNRRRYQQRALTPLQLASLRGENLERNITLYTPYPYPGKPGIMLAPIVNPVIAGGSNAGGSNAGVANSQYMVSFNMMKQTLSKLNQKLSDETERKINEKINGIIELENKLTEIYNNINEYTRILKKEKVPTNYSRTITLQDVTDLLSQYNKSNKQHIKEIVTLTNAFGKIERLIFERSSTNETQPKNELLFNI